MFSLQPPAPPVSLLSVSFCSSLFCPGASLKYVSFPIPFHSTLFGPGASSKYVSYPIRFHSSLYPRTQLSQGVRAYTNTNTNVLPYAARRLVTQLGVVVSTGVPGAHGLCSAVPCPVPCPAVPVA